MKKALILILIISVILGNWLFAANEIIIKYKSATPKAGVLSTCQALSTESTNPLSQVYILSTPSENIEAKLKELNSQPDVAYAIKNIRMQAFAIAPNDTFYAYGQKENLVVENVEQAWGMSQGSPTTIIAVIDTGVDYTHPDLVGRVLLGHDYINGDEDPMDDHGHGTHVAGVIGANGNNFKGIAGMDWNCKILAIKALDKYGSGWLSDVATAIIEATNKGARIINLSLGGKYDDKLIQDAIDYAYSKGVVIVAAAGNEGGNLDINKVSPVCNDGDHNEVIGVGSVGKDKVMSYFSNYSSKYVDICAVGENVLSTYPNSKYMKMSGTSMASPQVSGALGLILAVSPTSSVEGVKVALFRGAVDVDSIFGQSHPHEMGYGLLDVYAGILSLHPQIADASTSIITKFYNYPNPVIQYGSTNFDLACTQVPKTISITLFSQSGKMVRTIVGKPNSLVGFVGDTVAEWDLKDAVGTRVPSGVYIAVVAVTSDAGKQFKKPHKVVVK